MLMKEFMLCVMKIYLIMSNLRWDEYIFAGITHLWGKFASKQFH